MVYGGNQNDITATSIQPSVAENVIDAVKDIVMMFGEETDADAMVMDEEGLARRLWDEVMTLY